MRPLLFAFVAILLAACTTTVPQAPTPPAPTPPAPVATPQPVLLGNEVLALENFRPLAGKRVGLITNPSGVNRRLESTIDILRRAPGVKLVALFGPEHGIYGDVPAGDKIASRTDTRTGLPVHSLYGTTRKPTPKMLQGLDVLVYDLQDTGSRSYTFISTMGLAMEACGEAGIEFVVLDRPNPLGGLRIEGPRLEQEALRSFVSQWDVPYVYGMTCGELAQMINARWLKNPANSPSCPCAIGSARWSGPIPGSPGCPPRRTFRTAIRRSSRSPPA